MSDNGTPLGTFVNFVSAVVKALPRELSDDDMRYWDKRGGRELAEKLRIALTRDATSSYPVVGEEFALTFNFSSITPLGMVKANGYDHVNWKHRGRVLEGKRTFTCMLVQVGYQSSWDALTIALKKHGDLPNGMLREPFRAAYSTHDGKGSIGFADATWVPPSGTALFPYIHSGGDAAFSCAGRPFRRDWRFLVVVRK
jgi:hypothetical protein